VVIILDWLLLWWLRWRNPEWTVLRLRHGFRAYRLGTPHDVHADTLKSLAALIADPAGPGKPGMPS
jgi:hypothetical protein